MTNDSADLQALVEYAEPPDAVDTTTQVVDRPAESFVAASPVPAAVQVMDGVTPPIKLDDLVEEYVRLRDELGEASRKFKELKERTEDRLGQIDVLLRETCDRLGVNSISTRAGTAYRQKKEHYRVGDWDQIIKYIRDNDAWHMLEKRIGKLATAEIHKATGQLPPGVTYFAEVEFQVRRPTK